MAHLSIPEALPAIKGAMLGRPETAGPLNELTEMLLRQPSTLTPGEREWIANFVSRKRLVSSARRIRRHKADHLGGNEHLVLDVKTNASEAYISAKLEALLTIAGKVQMNGKNVLVEDVGRARNAGANRAAVLQAGCSRADCSSDPHRNALLSITTLSLLLLGKAYHLAQAVLSRVFCWDSAWGRSRGDAGCFFSPRYFGLRHM